MGFRIKFNRNALVYPLRDRPIALQQIVSYLLELDPTVGLKLLWSLLYQIGKLDAGAINETNMTVSTSYLRRKNKN